METLPRKQGAIVRIKLTNFMTFGSCEFRPGPRLNVILGPNGSGKSSLICAIGLGLGGQPKLLGRAAELKSFIKMGAKEAIIEIELYDEKGNNTIVERKILVDDETAKCDSLWRLNRKMSNLNKVQEALRAMEIQVDNLVQFLPQDKVAEFAQFNEIQLLRETIRAVLGTEHLSMQEKIAKVQKEVSQSAQNMERLTESKNQLIAENERNQHTVARQRDRVQLQEEIRMLSLKLPWLRFEEKRAEALSARDEVRRQEEEFSKGLSIVEPLKAQQKLIVREYEKAKRASDKAAVENKEWHKAVDERQKGVNDLLEKIDEEQDGLNSLEQSKKKALDNVAKASAKVEDCERQVAGSKGDEYYDAQLDELKARIEPLTAKEREARMRITNISAQKSKKEHELSRLKKEEQRDAAAASGAVSSAASAELENERIALIRKLKGSPDELKKLTNCRADIKAGKFSGRAIGPLVCELRADNEIVSRALEHVLRPNTWKFFAVSSEQDHSKLLDARISSLLIPSESAPNRSLSRSMMDELSLLGYMDELLKCDKLAIEAAKRLNQIDSIIVGSANTDKLYQADHSKFDKLCQILAKDNFNKLIIITPMRRIEFNRSRYGNREVTARVNMLDEGRLTFNLPLDRSAEEEEQRKRRAAESLSNRAELVKKKQALEKDIVQLQEQETEAVAEMDEYMEELKGLKAKKTSLSDERTKERKAAADLENAREKLEHMEKLANQNWEQKGEKYQRRIDELKSKLQKATIELVECTATMDDLAKRAAEHLLNKIQLDAEKEAIAEMIKEEEYKHNHAQAILDKLRERAAKLKEEAVKLKNEADRITGVVSEELLEKFSLLPDTSEEVAEAIDAKQFAVARIAEDNAAVMAYEENARKIAKYEADLAEMESSLESRKANLENQVEAWLAPVKDMANNINTKIKHFFGEINKGGYECAGEVALRGHEKGDLNQCGMEIQVKFRQEHMLARLDQSVQSGGERSLTTFLYMLALQELSAVPFRVVDEINQGMDADKERLAFYRLADVSSKCTSQYFLATPKLLPGLAFPKDATILFVFNGKHNLHQSEWDLKKFLSAGRTKRLSLSMNSEMSSKKKRVAQEENGDDE